MLSCKKLGYLLPTGPRLFTGLPSRGVLGYSLLSPLEKQFVGEGILLGQVYGWGSVLYNLPKPLIYLILSISYLPKCVLRILRLPVHNDRISYGRSLNSHLLLANSQHLPELFVAFSEFS
jgi:hypothetical protein